MGIFPHYVFRKNTKTSKWESDGGITFGFGHYVSKKEYGIDKEEKSLVDKYIKNASLLPANIPKDGVSYKVPGATYMTMTEVDKLLKSDIKMDEAALNDLFTKYNYSATQEQFDALVNLRYHKYKLGSDIDNLLNTRSIEKANWERAIKDLIGSKGDLKRADQLVDLFNEGKYPLFMK